MDENRVSGTARNAGGKIEEGLGRVMGDTKTQAEGIAKQVGGAAQTCTARRAMLRPTRQAPRATLLFR
jgi:uncharacterized protein YjbJ (UPF0337 family)